MKQDHHQLLQDSQYRAKSRGGLLGLAGWGGGGVKNFVQTRHRDLYDSVNHCKDIIMWWTKHSLTISAFCRHLHYCSWIPFMHCYSAYNIVLKSCAATQLFYITCENTQNMHDMYKCTWWIWYDQLYTSVWTLLAKLSFDFSKHSLGIVVQTSWKLVSVEMIPPWFNSVEVWAPGRPIHDRQCSIVCFSIWVCSFENQNCCQSEAFQMVLGGGSKLLLLIIPSILTGFPTSLTERQPQTMTGLCICLWQFAPNIWIHHSIRPQEKITNHLFSVWFSFSPCFPSPIMAAWQPPFHFKCSFSEY